MIRNRYLIIILFFISICLCLSQLEKSNIINKIEASLILNYYKSNSKVLSINLKDDYSNSLVSNYMNDSIEYFGNVYYLYNYKVKFLRKLDSSNLLEELYQQSVSKHQETAKLHINGLYGVTKNEQNFMITISGNSFEGYSIISKGLNLENRSIKDVINLKYYNYLPNNLKIDTSRNEFTFYSEILNRNFIGDYVFDKNFSVYKMELRHGVLIGD